jgi:hypothetical protein
MPAYDDLPRSDKAARAASAKIKLTDTGDADSATPTEKPVAIQGDLRNLPAALDKLKAMSNWVVWRFEWKNTKRSGGSWTKVPYQASNPLCNARNNDPSTWGSYDEALVTFEAGQCDGIGFNLLDADIAAFDIDDCRDPDTGAIAPEAMTLVERAASYTETTISGTGLRIIGEGNGTIAHRRQSVPNSLVSVESYANTGRYIVITGSPLPDTPDLADIGDCIRVVVQELEKTGGAKPQPQQEKDLPPNLVRLIDEGVPPEADRSAAFHHAVCWLSECGWKALRIEARIASRPIVPDRYVDRLRGEIERCLQKARASRADENRGSSDKPAKGWAVRMAKDFRATVSKSWIIKNVLAPGEVSNFYGLPGSGKSMLVGDLAVHITAGIDWRGYRSKQKGGVIYFALERADLVERRFYVQAEQYGLDPNALQFGVVNETIDMMNPGCVDEFVETIRNTDETSGTKTVVIMIDTSAKAIAAGGGDENHARDKNMMRANARRVMRAIEGLHVVFVSHCGKDDTRGERGSNAGEGDDDIRVLLNGATAMIDKRNDGALGLLTAYGMKVVVLGADEDGDVIDIAIINPDTTAASQEVHSDKIKMTPQQRLAMELLVNCVNDCGKPPSPSLGLPKSVTKVVTREQWREHCLKGGLAIGENETSSGRAFLRVVETLRAVHKIGIEDQLVWIAYE